MNTNTEFENLISNFYQRNYISPPSDENIYKDLGVI